MPVILPLLDLKYICDNIYKAEKIKIIIYDVYHKLVLLGLKEKNLE